MTSAHVTRGSTRQPASAVRFSVIVPAYNAGESVEVTVRSALAQEHDSFEVIVSDDGSSDDTLARARALAEEDPRVRVVTGDNGGCSVARNRAVEAASGEYCVLLDSDDRFEPGYLSAMDTFIERCPGYDIYSCNGRREFTGGRREPFFSGEAYMRETSWELADIIEIDRIFIVAVFRRELWELLGGFRDDLRYAEDYDFWLRALASRAKHRFTPQFLATYVETATGKSRNRIPHAEAQIRIFRDLAATPGLTEDEITLCGEKLLGLRARIERVKLETRLQEGDYRGARGAYSGLSAAYLSKPMYAAGWVAMMVSPRLYAALFARRAARRTA